MSPMTEQIKLPYLAYPTKTEKYFQRIKEVEVPQKFTYDFLENVMLFKSNNDRYLVSLLKKMGFLETSGIPTDLYKKFRNDAESKQILGIGFENAYSELYKLNKNLHKLKEDEITGYVKSATGQGDESSTLPLIIKTITHILSLSVFNEPEEKTKPEVKSDVKPEVKSDVKPEVKSDVKVVDEKFNLNYTISINLPETTNEEVYEKIFTSIKKILLTK